jgi:hypothetical protein
VAFLLVAAMLLGVGYAALTTTLNITGEATVAEAAAQEAFNEDISFKSAQANAAGDTAVTTDGSDVAEFTVNSLKGKNDTATFTFVIQNKGDLNATMSAPAITISSANAGYFTAVGSFNTTDLAAGGTVTYTVTVTLNNTPTEEISATFAVELTATSA